MAKEAKEKKVRVKKVRENKVPLKERIGSLFFTLIALVIAVVVFIGFIVLQNVFSENIIYKDVLVVVKEIPENEILTAENVQTYFGTRKMNELDTTEGAATPEQLEQLIGMKAKTTLHVGEEVTATDFKNVNVYLDYIEDPVEMSIATSGISGTDGGKIRGGDIVNITMMFSKEQLGLGTSYEGGAGTSTGLYINTPNSAGTSNDEYYANGEDGEGSKKNQMGSLTNVEDVTNGYNFSYYAKYMLENIYIKEVMTAGGVVVPPTDTETAADIVIIVVPKRIELQLNNIITNCSSMRVSKVLYEISPEDLFKDSALSNNIANLEELPVTEEEQNAALEGWTEPDEAGFRYKSLGNGTHKKWIDAGITLEESCEYGDRGMCIHCGQLKPEEDANAEGNEPASTEAPVAEE